MRETQRSTRSAPAETPLSAAMWRCACFHCPRRAEAVAQACAPFGRCQKRVCARHQLPSAKLSGGPKSEDLKSRECPARGPGVAMRSASQRRPQAASGVHPMLPISHAFARPDHRSIRGVPARTTASGVEAWAANANEVQSESRGKGKLAKSMPRPRSQDAMPAMPAMPSPGGFGGDGEASSLRVQVSSPQFGLDRPCTRPSACRMHGSLPCKRS